MTDVVESPWHTRSPVEVAAALGVDPGTGLSAVEVERRRTEHGPNLLAEAPRVPVWRKVAALLADRMTLVLVIAAVVSATVSREWETPVVIFAVIALNSERSTRHSPRIATLRTAQS